MAATADTTDPRTAHTASTVRAEVLIGCDDIAAALAFYGPLGFLVDSIYPAEHPEVCALRGHGIRLRLEPGGPSGVVLRLFTLDRSQVGSVVAPDGTVVEFIDADPPLVVPPTAQQFVVTEPEQGWGAGRAGMQYRDLLPGRLGGGWVASLIHLPGAGLVPDYVHFHKVRFQLIYCYRGWVRLVYEDQGEPFVMHPGDCVIQPPQIRHRVLESGDDLKVVEIGCPAIHETWADPATPLPTGVHAPERDFSGQQFVLHRADTAQWTPTVQGFEQRRFGIAEATAGLAEAAVARPRHADAAGGESWAHDGELCFTFVLDGSVTLHADGHPPRALVPESTAVLPAGLAHRWTDRSDDLQLLRVGLPASVIG